MFFPIISSFVILAFASTTVASPTPFNTPVVDRDLKTCNNNLALVVLKALKATPFCSDFLDLKPQTVIETITVPTVINAQTTISTTETLQFTATTTETNSIYITNTATLSGPTSTLTAFATITEVSTAFSDVTILATAKATATNYIRTGGPLKRDVNVQLEQRHVAIPSKLKVFASNVLSTACSCLVTPTSVTQTVTVTSTSTSLATVVESFTTSSPVATITSTILTTYVEDAMITLPGLTETTTLPTTTTSILTSTLTQTSIIATATTRVDYPPGAFTFVTRYSHCAILGSFYHRTFTQPFTTHEAQFQTCAAALASIPSLFTIKTMHVVQIVGQDSLQCLYKSTEYSLDDLSCYEGRPEVDAEVYQVPAW